MKLIIVRHGDPDYEHDTLTEQGWKEAELLSRRLVRQPADYYYVSPLGRARDTASCTMKKLGREPVVLDWLQEFRGRSAREYDCAWDWMPGEWTVDERNFTEKCFTTEAFRDTNTPKEYEWVCSNLDALLEKHGYQRCGRYYKAIRPNTDTVLLFCHFGLECVLLSHILNISPMALWHGTCAAPTSVTTLNTEERQEGIAYFRMAAFGDVTHLLSAGVEPSFSARFCEVYSDFSQRH